MTRLQSFEQGKHDSRISSGLQAFDDREITPPPGQVLIWTPIESLSSWLQNPPEEGWWEHLEDVYVNATRIIKREQWPVRDTERLKQFSLIIAPFLSGGVPPWWDDIVASLNPSTINPWRGRLVLITEWDSGVDWTPSRTFISSRSNLTGVVFGGSGFGQLDDATPGDPGAGIGPTANHPLAAGISRLAHDLVQGLGQNFSVDPLALPVALTNTIVDRSPSFLGPDGQQHAAYIMSRNIPGRIDIVTSGDSNVFGGHDASSFGGMDWETMRLFNGGFYQNLRAVPV